MKNFNKKLQENLEEFQNDNEKKDDFKEDLKARLKENEERLKNDEKLLEELEKFKDKINKEAFTKKLDELAKQNKNKQRSMKQLLELTKRFYVAKKAEKLQKQLEDLAEKQKVLSDKEKTNTETEQNKLNKEFEKLQEELDELKQEDRRLQKPMKIPRDKPLEDMIKHNQDKAKEALNNEQKEQQKGNTSEGNKQKQKAKQKQKQAAEQIKEMSDKLKKAAASGAGEQMSEDIDMLRQILENLLLYSFDQEELMNTFKSIETDNNNYGKHIVKQHNLRTHFEHIDDSLFALSLRQPKLSEQVNTQISNVYYNVDKALDQFTENGIYQGVSFQQYAVTASNELASFLSDILDNMESSLNPSPGSGEGGMQLPDIIMSQEELTKQLQEELNKGKEEGSNSGEEGKDKQGEKGEGESGKGEDGEQGEGDQGQGGKGKGQSGQQGEKGNQGKDGDGQNGEQGQGGNDGGKGSGNNNGNGKNGNDGEGKNGEARDAKLGSKEGKGNDGYGEGGSEEQNAKLFEIYQQQQLLRQALEDRIKSDGGEIQSVAELIKQMEDVESDLLNFGFTNSVLQKMQNLQHRLLKLDKATFEQGQDNKRQSKTNKKVFDNNGVNQIPTAKEYFNTTEILNRQVLPLRQRFKKKTQEYFKTANDKH